MHCVGLHIKGNLSVLSFSKTSGDPSGGVINPLD